MAKSEEPQKKPFPFHQLIPKEIVNQPKFLQKHPEFDGRGTVIAILDTGVDLACPGLQVTSTGEPKIIDAVNFTGSGDVITTEIWKIDEKNEIIGLSGRKLRIPSSWKNPSNEYRLGLKRVYELYPGELETRIHSKSMENLKSDTEKLMADALQRLNEHVKAFGSQTDDRSRRRERDELEAQFKFLNGAYLQDDAGPVLDCLVWHDGEDWRACVDNTFKGDLEKCVVMTDFRKERQWGFVTPEDGLSYCLAIRNNGSILEITTPSGYHGTHCAHIAAAHYPESPDAGGVAPGAQVVSICIGDHRLHSAGSSQAFYRALHYCVEIGVDIINYSYGSNHIMISNSIAVDLLNRLVCQHGIPFFTSAGNDGPILTSMSDPGAQTSTVVCVGAVLPEDTDTTLYGDSEPRPTRVFEFSSRGPTSEGRLGLSFSAPGTAYAGVPFYTQRLAEQTEGTSMASPNAVGCAACLISGAKKLSIPFSPFKLRLALENSARVPPNAPQLSKLDYGHGIIDIDGAFELLLKMNNIPKALAEIATNVRYSSTSGSEHEEKGVYIRDAYQLENSSDYFVSVEPWFREDQADNRVLHNFNIPIRLFSPSLYVSHPKNIYMTNDRLDFKIRVDHSDLEPGKVYFTEVLGFDDTNEEIGPVFRVPITLIKPIQVEETSLRKVLKLVAGQPERLFLRCPIGATTVTVIVRSMKKSSTDLLVVHFSEKIASSGHCKPLPLEPNSELKLNSSVRDKSSFEFCAVLDLHNFDRETEIEVDFRFSGCYLHAFEMQSAAIVGQISVSNALTHNILHPSIFFYEATTQIRPLSALIEPLHDRVKFMEKMETFTLTLTYQINVEEAVKHEFYLHGGDDLQFSNHVENVCIMVFSGQCLVDFVDFKYHLEQGEYRVMVQIRHQDLFFLNTLKTSPLESRRHIPMLNVDLATSYEAALKGAGSFQSLAMRPGQTRKLYYDGKFVENLPKWLKVGDCLHGDVGLYDKALYRRVILRITTPFVDRNDMGETKLTWMVEEKEEKSETEILKESHRALLINHIAGTTDGKLAEELFKEVSSKFPDYPEVYLARLKHLHKQPSRDMEKIKWTVEKIIDLIDFNSLTKYMVNIDNLDVEHLKVQKKVNIKVATLAEAYTILLDSLMDDYLAKSKKNIPDEFRHFFEFTPDLGFNTQPIQHEGIWKEEDYIIHDEREIEEKTKEKEEVTVEARKENIINFDTIANVIMKLEEAKRRAKSSCQLKQEKQPDLTNDDVDPKDKYSHDQLKNNKTPKEVQEKSIELPSEKESDLNLASKAYDHKELTITDASKSPKAPVDPQLAEIDRVLVEFSKLPEPPPSTQEKILFIKFYVCQGLYGIAIQDLTDLLATSKCQRAYRAVIQMADILGWRSLANQWRNEYLARYCIPNRNF